MMETSEQAKITAITNAKTLKTVASAISTLLIDEATFIANSKGISFRSMNPTHESLIDINMPNTAFEQYQCDEEIRFGIRINELLKLLKGTNKNDMIEVSVDEKFTLQIYNSYSKTYKLNLVDALTTDTPLPKLSFNAKIRMQMKTFKEIIIDLAKIGDWVTIDANKDRVIFAGKGDAGDVSVTLREDNERLTELEVQADSKATYSLEYLSAITKAVANADELTIEFANAMPIKIEFKVQEIKINYYLAPRVER